MEANDLVPLIETLDDNIDDLEEALAPLLKGAISDAAGKLPLLDKAQLYVLVTYAIESILFSFLRLQGVNAKDHPVFRELTRVKQYFEKIKVAESAATRPSIKLDKAAAGRFIKHALAGNENHDLTTARQQQAAKTASHVRFEQASMKLESEQEANGKSESASEDPVQETRNATVDIQAQVSMLEDPSTDSKLSKSRKKRKRGNGGKKGNSNSEEAPSNAADVDAKRERKRAKKALKKRQRELEGHE